MSEADGPTTGWARFASRQIAPPLGDRHDPRRDLRVDPADYLADLDGLVERAQGLDQYPTGARRDLEAGLLADDLDDALFLRLGGSKTLAFGTFRGAFHVPFIVPAASIPDDLASSGAARSAKVRGEPFVIESHSLRQPWDATNFEIRPLAEVMTETFDDSITYATGTILFAPLGDALLR